MTDYITPDRSVNKLFLPWEDFGDSREQERAKQREMGNGRRCSSK
jgi:hypothetical protein